MQSRSEADRQSVRSERESLGLPRRGFLGGAALAALTWGRRGFTQATAPALREAAAASAELAHAEIWRRFVDPLDVLLDFTDLDGSVDIPTPEECRTGRPNALGWWTPIENGAMFNGLYLDGLIERWRTTRAEEDAAKVRRMVAGLMRLSECSTVPGFIGRGFATDGRTTWPMGSNDQTTPWFYGLWRYLLSGPAEDAERTRIVARLSEVAGVLAHNGWRMPAEPPFHFRGSIAGLTSGAAPRVLFVCKALHQLTGERAWEDRYRSLLRESARGRPTRLKLCEGGMTFEDGRRHTWTGACSVVCLRGLWELEQDADLRTAFARGLAASATLAAEGMSQRSEFSHDEPAGFERDWRKLHALWKPQQTEQDAETVARAQLTEINRLSPRRRVELRQAREAMFAAWVTTLCPDRAVVSRYEAEILATIAGFHADRLHFVSFFPLASAWQRLQTLPA